MFGQQPFVQIVALGCDLSLIDPFEYGTAGFVPMAAVVKPAMRRTVTEFRKTQLDVVGIKMMQSKGLEARRVDDVASPGVGQMV